jgi:EpsI family protein
VSQMSVRLVVLAALLAGTAAYLGAASRPEQAPARKSLSEFPMTLNEWRGERAPDLDAPTLQVLGVDDYLSRVYSLNGEPAVSVYVGYYASQRRGDTIHSPMNCLPGAGWIPAGAERIEIPTDVGTRLDVNRVLIQKGEERQVALYWYQGRGRTVANEYWSKAFLVWDAATRNRTDGALVRVISPIRRSEASEAPADERVQRFVRAAYPYFAEYLPD